ncbi:MAG: hypothetical protein AMXMBFR34_24440 [Myxococcaceae bacterium]
MAGRTGWGRFVDSVKGVFGGAPARPPPAQPPAVPASTEVRAAYEQARPMYDQGRWRAALQALDAVRAGESADPKALALWIQCKASLGERAPVVAAFRTLLALPDAGIEQLIDGYSHTGADGQLEFGPQYVARVEAAGLGPEEQARALVTVPKALWPADRVFAALASTTETGLYDELLALAKKRFQDDPRLGQVKVRPLDRRELQRQATEKEHQRREALKASRARLDASAKKRGAGSADEVGARLEAAVFSNRDDVQAHRVFGDWLQQQGDPRGELVMVQAERQARPDDDGLKTAEDAAITKAAGVLLGALGGLEGTRATFRLGFLHGIRLGLTYGDQLEDRELIEYFLELDEARFVRELTVGPLHHDDQYDFGETIAQLAAAADRLPSLESLFIADFESEDCELSWSALGDASPLYAAFPKLKALTLRAGSMELGRIEHPALERFAIETGGLSRSSLEAVLKAKWPRIRSLSLWFGQDNYGGECTVDDVRPLLTRSDWKLTHLGLGNCEFLDELTPLLVRSPLLPGLESLDLSKGCLTATGAQVLAQHGEQLRHLKRVDLSENCLAEEDLVLVKDLCAEVLVAGQDEERAADEHRYSAVGE